MKYLFHIYQKSHCPGCIRAVKCEQDQDSITFCATNTMFKGIDDIILISPGEANELNRAREKGPW